MTAATIDSFGLEVWGCRQPLAKFAHYLTRRADRAEDLTAETMARAIAKRHLYRGPSLLAWLKGIARNLWRDFCRSALSRDVPLAPDEIAAAADDAVDSPQEWPLHLREVRAAVAELPERQRLALALAVNLELSTEQLGRTLGIHKSNAARLLARARTTLAEKTGW